MSASYIAIQPDAIKIRDRANTIADRLAELGVCRWRAEVELLSGVAPIGRWGVALAERAGISAEHFSEEDTAAIWLTFKFCDERNIFPAIRRAKLCRAALVFIGRWSDDGDDNRQFVSGDTWHAGALAALFHRVSPRDAEEIVPRLAAALRALVREHAELADKAARIRRDAKAVAA